ncbi:MAG: FAD-binding protein [Betaproteobacteria bacterium]|nr:FAD-binding protein [Betaproteobacteria bacterium]
MRIVIAGAGIGGLTAALALKQQGFEDVLVVEQAPELREVGAGVQLGPNAAKVLHKLGLEDALRKVAVAPVGTQSRNWRSGRIIRDFPLGDAYRERYGAPHLHIHRAHLHAMLADAVGRQSIRLASKFAGFSQDAGGVTLKLVSGEELRGDALIGADGVHSVIRAGVLGPDKPRFSGLAAWRGITPADSLRQFDIEKHTHAWWGANKHFVHYYVDSGKLMNWVGVVPAGEWRLESWSAKGGKDEVLAEFDGWHPIVRGIVDASTEHFKWALYDRDPMPGWSKGRVTLLGDAAHSMLPFMSQGAAQSVEDGYVLGLCLAGNRDDVVAALAHYEAVRYERASRVQLGSRANGDVFHLTSPWQRLMRDVRFRIASFTRHSEIHRKLDWLFGYDCEEAVARAATT